MLKFKNYIDIFRDITSYGGTESVPFDTADVVDNEKIQNFVSYYFGVDIDRFKSDSNYRTKAFSLLEKLFDSYGNVPEVCRHPYSIGYGVHLPYDVVLSPGETKVVYLGYALTGLPEVPVRVCLAPDRSFIDLNFLLVDYTEFELNEGIYIKLTNLRSKEVTLNAGSFVGLLVIKSINSKSQVESVSFYGKKLFLDRADFNVYNQDTFKVNANAGGVIETGLEFTAPSGYFVEFTPENFNPAIKLLSGKDIFTGRAGHTASFDLLVNNMSYILQTIDRGLLLGSLAAYQYILLDEEVSEKA